MIPRAAITKWRQSAPWKFDAQVEQDLILSRVLVELFSNPVISERVLFRGGTALHKLFFQPAARYSEDIDLVQKDAGGIGDVMAAVRAVCNPLLGRPKTKQRRDSVMFIYKVSSEIPPSVPLRVKVEINTREHFSVFPYIKKSFDVQTVWFSGKSTIKTYSLEELLGTKLRALYQRNKGRDLFDLWLGLSQGEADRRQIVQIFRHYLAFQELKVSGTEFRNNLKLKIRDSDFLNDIIPIKRPEISYSINDAYRLVDEELLSLL